MKRKILIVEDNVGLSQIQKDWLSQAGYEAVTAMNEPIARSLIRKTQFDLILSDVRLPEGDGISLLEWLRKEKKDIPFIITTEYVSVPDVVRTIKLGARDYLPKPVHRDYLLELAEDIFHPVATVRKQERQLFHRTSPMILKVEKFARLVAPSEMSVMILGANGTGKESVAQTIHDNSERYGKPFVAVNCGALPRELAASLFFGHEKGAFTGADTAKSGYFDLAKGGTLFLDEVGELPLPVQGAFLRALELRRFRPVGEVREVESDFRLVAATNRDLDDMVGMDLYRSDLRFRLRGMTIHVPPLRRRAEDIPLLAEHFTARYCQRHELPNKELTPDCYAMLADYSWPGNVRELRHTIERACAAAGDGTQLFTRHLPTEIRIELARKRLVHLSEPEESAPTAPLPEQEPSTQPRKPETFPTLRDMKAKAERDYIAGLFAACQGDVRRAAGIAGVSRGHFYELLKKYGLDRTSSIPEFPAI